MRGRLHWFGMIGALLVLASCASGNSWEWDRPGVSGGSGVSDGTGVTSGNLRLDDYLARQPGVTVDGSGSNARVHVRGGTYGQPPLFVIDELAVGYDFSRVWYMAPMSEIESIKVIRATDGEAVRYGSRGGNGVIEIYLKRGGA